MSLQVSYKKQFLLLLMGILIILSVLEISSRLYEIFNPECFFLNSDATKKIDFELRKKICEQSELVKTSEYPVFQYIPNQNLDTININSYGFRGEDFALEKNPEKYRIFMVGGSTTFGSGSTSDKNTIPYLLEKIFIENDYNVEVINAGVGAADSREEAYKIRNMYKIYQPDLFLIYDGWNDSFKKLNPSEINPNVGRSEEINLMKSPLQLWISDNLSFYRTLYVIYPYINHFLISLSLNEKVFESNAEIWSQRWSDLCFENNLEGIETIILLQPVVGTGDKELSRDEEYHAQYIKAIKTREQLDYFSKYLPIQNCTASFDIRDSVDDTLEPVYYDGGHMVDLGNQLVADKIYMKIEPVLRNKIN